MSRTAKTSAAFFVNWSTICCKICCKICRGGDSQARLKTADTDRLPLKWHQPPNCHCEERSDVAISGRQLQFVQGVDKMHGPIASVAALTAQPLAALPPYGCGVPLAGSERLAGWQYLRHGFNGMRLPGLSLRGPNGAVAISGRQLRFRRGFPVIHSGTARLPRRFAPRNDTSGECGGAPAPSSGLMTPYKALTDCRYTPYFGAYRLTTACLLRQCSAGPGCPIPYNA